MQNYVVQCLLQYTKYLYSMSKNWIQMQTCFMQRWPMQSLKFIYYEHQLTHGEVKQE